MHVNTYNFIKIDSVIKDLESDNKSLLKLKYHDDLKLLKNVLNQAILLSQKYEITLTNPRIWVKKV